MTRLPEWTTACPDWADRLRYGQPEDLIPCEPLFPEFADECMGFFTQLRIVDVLGQPTIGECSRPWFLNLARVIFGSLDPETGQRHIQTFFVMMPKKSTKSTLMAGVALTLDAFGFRSQGITSIASATKDAANSVWEPIRGMIQQDRSDDPADAVLSNIYLIRDAQREAENQSPFGVLGHPIRSKIKVTAAEKETVVGSNATNALLDELHIFGTKNSAYQMLSEFEGGLLARKEGMVMLCTTMSSEDPAGVFKAKLEYARAVRDGKIEDKSFLPVIFEFPPYMLKSKEYKNPDNWHMVCPNMGMTQDIDYIRRKLDEAARTSDRALRELEAKYLNVPPGTLSGDDIWAAAEHWDNAADTTLTLDAVIDRSEVLTVGIDGGGLDDLLGLAVLGRERETKKWLCWTGAVLTPAARARQKQNETQYQKFEREQSLTTVDDDMSDLVWVVDKVDDCLRSGKLASVGVDPAGLGSIVDELDAIGVTQESGLLYAVRQGWGLMGAMKAIEKKLAAGWLVHGGSALMRWCVGNARLRRTPNAVHIQRDESGANKIDPVIALLNAAYLMALNPQPKSRLSGLETQDILFLS